MLLYQRGARHHAVGRDVQEHFDAGVMRRANPAMQRPPNPGLTVAGDQAEAGVTHMALKEAGLPSAGSSTEGSMVA